MDMDMDKTNNVNISAIDRALAAAKARKAAKEEFSDADAAPMLRKAEKSMIKPDAAEKAAVKALKDAQKANKKAERDAERARRKMEKSTVQAVKKTSHMKKVERALSKLPRLNEATQLIFNEATCNISGQQLDALAQNILHHNRMMSTVNAMKSNMLRIGDMVRITGGEPKFIGMVGTVAKSRQLRAKIQVEGVEKLVYIFTGQAELFTPSASAVG